MTHFQMDQGLYSVRNILKRVLHLKLIYLVFLAMNMAIDVHVF